MENIVIIWSSSPFVFQMATKKTKTIIIYNFDYSIDLKKIEVNKRGLPSFILKPKKIILK